MLTILAASLEETSIVFMGDLSVCGKIPRIQSKYIKYAMMNTKFSNGGSTGPYLVKVGSLKRKWESIYYLNI